MKYITGFFAFWYDFIVGDAWEVAAGVALSLVAIYLAVRYGGSTAITFGVVLLPAVIVILLAYSLWRVRGTS